MKSHYKTLLQLIRGQHYEFSFSKHSLSLVSNFDMLYSLTYFLQQDFNLTSNCHLLALGLIDFSSFWSKNDKS